MGDKASFFSLVRSDLPDIVCLQETGMPELTFPDYTRLEGYHSESAFDPNGIGTAGVSVLTRDRPNSFRRTVCDAEVEHDKCRGRFIAATWSTFSVSSVYAPNPDASNGRPNQARFLDCLQKHMLSHSHETYIVTGDFNTILGDSDTYDRVKTRSSPWANLKARAMIGAIFEGGWFDTFRRIHGQGPRRVSV